MDTSHKSLFQDDLLITFVKLGIIPGGCLNQIPRYYIMGPACFGSRATVQQLPCQEVGTNAAGEPQFQARKLADFA